MHRGGGASNCVTVGDEPSRDGHSSTGSVAEGLTASVAGVGASVAAVAVSSVGALESSTDCSSDRTCSTPLLEPQPAATSTPAITTILIHIRATVPFISAQLLPVGNVAPWRRFSQR